MGKNNSSLTRVQPIFNKLYEMDNSGKSWLLPLLEMGDQSDDKLNNLEFTDLISEPKYEFKAEPPKLFLEWLIKNPKKLTIPSESYWKKLGKVTRAKRTELLDLNQKVQTEALGKLERNIGTTKGKWWSFEGITYVDCTLITSEVVVFIEGKRTELGPSKNILWYPHRNQILRNLECAFEFIKNTNKKFFVLLITKKIDEYDKNDAKRKEQIEKTIDPETIKNSFPHLTENQIDRLLEHYLGATNWQDIVSIFKLPKSLLD